MIQDSHLDNTRNSSVISARIKAQFVPLSATMLSVIFTGVYYKCLSNIRQ